MTIEELYSEPCFEAVVYYLKQNGFSFVQDLASFDFDELFFVPNVGSDIIEQAKSLYQNAVSAAPEVYAETSSSETPSEKESFTAPFSEEENLLSAIIADCCGALKISAEQFKENPDLIQKIKHLLTRPAYYDKQLSNEERDFVLFLCNELKSHLIREQYTPEEIQRMQEIPVEVLFSDTVNESGRHCENVIINYCKANGYFSMLDMCGFDFDRTKIVGLGESSMLACKKKFEYALEVIRFPERFPNERILIRQEQDRSQFGEKELSLMAQICVEKVFENTVTENGSRCGKPFIRYCKSQNIHTLLDLFNANLNFSTLKVDRMGPGSLAACQESYLHFLEVVQNPELYPSERPPTVKKLFIAAWNKLSPEAQYCMSESAHGRTLQSLADELGLTREGIRQKLNKGVRILGVQAEAVAQELFHSYNGVFSIADLHTYFNSSEMANGCFYTLHDKETYTYWPCNEKFYLSLPENWKTRLQEITEEIIGDGVNYFDNLEIIEEKLKESGFTLIDFYDLLSYLQTCGYKLYGEFLARSRRAYALICCDVIEKYFPDGIKLDSDDNNPDLLRLREIVRTQYGNYELPPNNRALTARISAYLILCGRGTYCLPSKIFYSQALIDDILSYIDSSPEVSLYYSEIFLAFQGRLLMETNIDNYNCLHGLLKYLYPDEYQYDRDTVTKLGKEKISLDSRIAELILSKGCAVSKDEIINEFPGVTDIRIFNALAKEPKLIQWTYGYFNHIDNILYNDEDKAILRQILTVLTDDNNEYCSDKTFYKQVISDHPEFIDQNSITESLNLFYIAEYFFKPEFRFGRPHIVSSLFPDIELTNLNICKYFIGQNSTFTSSDVKTFARSNNLSDSFVSFVLAGLENDYIRLNDEEYLKKECLHLSEDTLNDIRQTIALHMQETSYTALFAAFNYNYYPDIGYKWNEFLLQSIITAYNIGYKIIEPKTKDRRTLRGIIVPVSSPFNSYEELVIYQMKKDGMQKIPQDSFTAYLQSNGLLLTYNIPQELYSGDGVRLERDFFICE